MKTRLTIFLAVLVLVALGVLDKSITNTTSARSSNTSRPEGTITPAEAPPAEAMSATCFCRVTANGTEVAKPTKGGYVQPFQAEACRNYCRGLWDGNSSQRVGWAHQLPNACGDVSVQMEAALGTMGYQTVRGPEVEHGINGTQFVPSCPTGQVVSNSFGGNRYCIPPTGIQLALQPDQLMGAYLLQSQVLYKILGPAGKKCV